MATPTARLLIDKDNFPFEAGRDERGLTISQCYSVDTGDVVAALFANGLPTYGTPYSAAYPLITAQGFRTTQISSLDDTATGLGGETKVQVTYRAISAPGGAGNGPRVPRDVTDRWTDIEFGVGQAQVFWPISRLSNPSPGGMIANGDGASVYVGNLTASIYTFWPRTTAIDLSRIVSLISPCCTNNAPLTLPKVWQTTSPMNVDAGQLLYLGIDKPVLVGMGEDGNGGLLQVVHKVMLGSDFYARWEALNERGGRNTNFSGAIVDQVQPEGDLSGMW